MYPPQRISFQSLFFNQMTDILATLESREILIRVRIDYVRDSPDPARVFRAMSRTIEAIRHLEDDLAKSVAVSIQPVVLLQDIEAGSLVTWIKTTLDVLGDDTGLSTGWELPTARYLRRAVIAVLSFIEDRETISTEEEAVTLQRNLVEIANDSGATLLQSGPVPMPNLYKDLREFGAAAAELGPGDTASVSSAGESVSLNPRFRLSSDESQRLLTRAVSTNKAVLSLVVKKPDYLGASMWEVRYDDRVVDAKILDGDWLNQFQSGSVPLAPGDGLRAETVIEIHKGENGTTVAEHYYVTKVLRVLPGLSDLQGALPLAG
ncbi:hypothetical protein [Longimicrobium terrae]|uniref:Uncharacterized protein n=1 Tax=Longimicrobium terrae TaxID=1639882 RepID=A0A841GUT7_9BACT|nr:hypothetical protein [Longimicrobium terrae]MBB4634853.1 hypothetical protein [Longimicrobium terrae]MBB6069248.1 hypothetical protein [Longimicrobium terrae]NNC31942.1 hypothetical protein [Longimicrobium terrae]